MPTWWQILEHVLETFTCIMEHMAQGGKRGGRCSLEHNPVIYLKGQLALDSDDAAPLLVRPRQQTQVLPQRD
jgi:hypothetical protein